MRLQGWLSATLAGVFALAPMAFAQSEKTESTSDDNRIGDEIAISERESRRLADDMQVLQNKTFRELDLYLAQSLAQPLGTGTAATDVGNIDTSLRRLNREDSAQFFILDDNRPNTVTRQSPVLAKPALLSGDGVLRGLSDQSRTAARGTIGFTFGTEVNEDGSIDRGFEVAVRSAVQTNAPLVDTENVESLLLTNSGVATDREYNVGLQLGYSGFNVDANIIRLDSAFAKGTQGLEAGLSYQGNVFAARLSAAEYQRGKDLLGIENGSRRLISFELEASYRLTNRFGLTAGARYSDFGERFLINSKDGQKTQMVFVGGRFSF